MTETKKIALVTGANKGIGKEIARQLLAEDILVLIGSRDSARGQAAAEELGTRSVVLDVTDQASVEAAAKLVEDEYGRLDILVNNAGITAAGQGKPSETSADVVRTVYDTNVFGVVRVTNAFIPLLRRSSAPRIVNVSSRLGSIAQNVAAPPELPRLLAYNTSKSALNAVTVLYADELRADGIKVNAIEPGYCATDLNDHQGFLDPAEGAKVAVVAALIANDGPTGEFRADDGIVPW
jgi:NAD(P)-dependent dehydrogenase (short-subunit alcohol dehydrogenase family)